MVFYASDDREKKKIIKRLQHGTGGNLAQRTAKGDGAAGQGGRYFMPLPSEEFWLGVGRT